MRPKLKSDTFYVPIENGVYFRNNEHSFVMKGRTIASWIERLAPYLDGRYDIERLTRSLPPEKRSMVPMIIGALQEHGYIKDASADQPHSLPAETLALYAPAITFIDYYTDSAAHRFELFLTQPVLAIGSGDALVTLAHALLETGNRQIHLLDTAEEKTDYARIDEVLTALQVDRDAALTLHTLSVADWGDDRELQALLPSFKMVIFFSTRSSPAFVHRLAELCYRADVPFLPAMVLGEQLVIGPTQRPPAPGCWQCYWRRRRAVQGLPVTDECGRLVLPDNPPASTQLAMPALAIAANLLAFEFFKQGSGVKANRIESDVFVLDLETLDSARHHVFAHPLCTICRPTFPATPDNLAGWAAQVSDELSALQQHDGRFELAEFVRQTDEWTDEHAGIFTRIEVRDFFQLPLIRTRIDFADPSGCGQLTVNATGLEYADTRLSAVQAAVPLYLERLADSSNALPATCAQLSARWELIHPQQLFGWTGGIFAEEQPTGWLWAYQLDNHCPVLVPAAAVYPYSRWNRRNGTLLFQHHTSSIGVGTTWYEALARGLQALSILLEPPTAPGRPIARAVYANDATCAAYLKMLDILNAEVTLVDLTGTSGLPSIAAYLNNQLVHIATHWDTTAATSEALKAAVLAVQIQRFPAPGNLATTASGTPGTTPELAVLPADAQPVDGLPPTLAAATDYQEAAQALLSRLRARGWEPIVANIGTDPTIASVLRCTLRVLATYRQGSSARR